MPIHDALRHMTLELQLSFRSPVEDCMARIDRSRFSHTKFAPEGDGFALFRDVSGI
jgi:hypothetical protein